MTVPAHQAPAPYQRRPDGTPLLSILVPVYRTDRAFLSALLRSVSEQSDPDWELLLVDDCSQDAALTALLQQAAARDRRVRVDTLPRNSGIVGASNHGLAMARGEFVALLDHDDVLDRDTVRHCRRAVERTPAADVLYTDEAIIDPEGNVQGVFRKPVFSPERLRRQNFTLHLSVYRRSLLERIGGFRAGFDGSQDYDLILRASEVAREVVSIPYPLYSWRIVPTSVSHTAGNDWVFDSAVRSVQEHLDRTGIRGTVVQVDVTGRYRIDREPPAETTVSVVVLADPRTTRPDAGADHLAGLVATLTAEAGTRLADVTVVLRRRPLDAGAVSTTAVGVALTRRVRSWAERGRLVETGDLNSDAVNEAVARAGGSTVLLVADALALGSPPAAGWFAPLLGLVTDPGIAAVGPRLLDRGGRVSSAGLALSDGAVHPVAHGADRTDPGPFGGFLLTREVTALPADLLLVDRAEFLRVGGLWTGAAVPVAVLDLCLKLQAAGRSTVVCAESEFGLSGADRLHPTPDRTDPIAHRWGSAVTADRFWRDR